MGCDIHIYAEVRKTKLNVFGGQVDKWEFQEDRFRNENYNPKYPKTEWNREFTSEPYPHRNYNLFAILANVRNGYGFAGVDTGDGFKPISIPKGLPDDVSPQIKEVSDRWGVDGHSHSYHTLSDLKSYDWNQVSVLRGVITLNQYSEIRGTGKSPDSWCGAVSGRNIVTVSMSEADALLANPAHRNSSSDYYVRYQWQETYSGCVGSFLTESIPALERLGNDDDVRIVFWFDN